MSDAEHSDEAPVFLSGPNFALFANSENGCDGDLEQLTNWNTIDSAKKSKSNWFEKDRRTFLMARIST